MSDDIKQSTSHKGEKRHSFTMELKSSIISFAKEYSIDAASKRFNVDRKRVREWCQSEEKLLAKKHRCLVRNVNDLMELAGR